MGLSNLTYERTVTVTVYPLVVKYFNILRARTRSHVIDSDQSLKELGLMNEHLLKENLVHVTRRPHVGEHLLERNLRLSVHSADKAPTCRNGSGRTRW